MKTFGKGYQRMFASGELTLGVFFAIEAYPGSLPTMVGQVALAQRAEALGFSALWVRDVPLLDPSFGDAGQIFDPWVFLGFIVAQTRQISLATGSIILPLRHPLELAKAAASVDQLSGGRLVLGIASGDRPVEFPAFGKVLAERGAAFRETLSFFRRVLEESFPLIVSPLGRMDGSTDLIPKPVEGRLPLLVTGNSQQSVEWIAANADGWVMYPRPLILQRQVIQSWRLAVEGQGDGKFKPFAQSLYIDLVEDEDASPVPIHLGYRLGRKALLELLQALKGAGVNHVIFNLKYGRRPAAEVLEELGQEIVPHFPTRA